MSEHADKDDVTTPDPAYAHRLIAGYSYRLSVARWRARSKRHAALALTRNATWFAAMVVGVTGIPTVIYVTLVLAAILLSIPVHRGQKREAAQVSPAIYGPLKHLLMQAGMQPGAVVAAQARDQLITLWPITLLTVDATLRDSARTLMAASAEHGCADGHQPLCTHRQGGEPGFQAWLHEGDIPTGENVA